jgi:hypothetical protein
MQDGELFSARRFPGRRVSSTQCTVDRHGSPERPCELPPVIACVSGPPSAVVVFQEIHRDVIAQFSGDHGDLRYAVGQRQEREGRNRPI